MKVSSASTSVTTPSLQRQTPVASALPPGSGAVAISPSKVRDAAGVGEDDRVAGAAHEPAASSAAIRSNASVWASTCSAVVAGEISAIMWNGVNRIPSLSM